MTALKKSALLFAIIAFVSCSKGNGNNPSTTDFSGKYQGPTISKVTAGGQTATGSYDLVLDISKGSNDKEIKILFGNWLTVASLNGNKFTIQPTTFSGPITTTGNGEFSGNKLIINYTQNASGETINYSGTLTKF